MQTPSVRRQERSERQQGGQSEPHVGNADRQEQDRGAPEGTEEAGWRELVDAAQRHHPETEERLPGRAAGQGRGQHLQQDEHRQEADDGFGVGHRLGDAASERIAAEEASLDLDDDHGPQPGEEHEVDDPGTDSSSGRGGRQHARTLPRVADRPAAADSFGGVVAFLTESWVDELDRALQHDERAERATSGVRIVVQQVVTDEGEGTFRYALRVEDGSVRAVPGEAADADVTFVQDRHTATAIARGDLAAQAAFMDGRLRVGGDLDQLIRSQAALGGLDDVLAEVRARTEFGTD